MSKIIQASLSDISALVKLVNSAYRGDSSKQGWTTEADLVDGMRVDDSTLKDMMMHPHGNIFNYVDDNDIIQGCIYLEKQNDRLYLGLLTVNPQIQAKGIGKQLLAKANEYAKEAGINKVYMRVISLRHELISWYERHGYTKTGEVAQFPADGKMVIPKQHLVLIILEKTLL